MVAEKIRDRSNGDVAVDSYHKYKEDIELIKDLNMDAYRFSISWSRVLPKGKLSGGVNPEGIKYYNNLINELLAKEMILETMLNFCFKEFGDRVKHWITINEPWSVSMNAYAFGKFAPGRCSDWLNLNCTGGDSGTEPYLTAHNQLLAHSAAVNLYRIKYKVFYCLKKITYYYSGMSRPLQRRPMFMLQNEVSTSCLDGKY
ncbi:hypothetical protein KIW84_075807 [Lathyrus oleraceus]|uniref:Uncharacterized protein n=1 Tax=Pisum sativum TaxID=3888 RepID=A0A9D4VUN0_PEA|nr:hypothetical protein KIW84_075807 [Pisum sativum]